MPASAHATMRPGRHLAAPLLAATLAGCTLLTPAQAPASRQYDGVYAGATTLTQGWGYVCGVPDLPRRISVMQGRFAFPFQEQPPSLTSFITVPIAADGSFDKSTTYYEFAPRYRGNYTMRWVTIAGRVVGNTLELTETDARCARRSVLRRRQDAAVP